ncbi:hypothetical protein B4113_2554 [Geobacillus sp. B4113_201601]|nr:hypothetical protein B4113_2554 [Geobacillus sp. B4113_201601]
MHGVYACFVIGRQNDSAISLDSSKWQPATDDFMVITW